VSPTFTMIRLTESEAGSTPTAIPAGTRSIPPVTNAQIRKPSVERAAVDKGGIVTVGDPCPPGFGSFLQSRGFNHRIAFALPFGLASTHAGVWQCRPAVTLSGRLTSGARSRASAVPSSSGPLHQPGAGIPAGTDEMFVVLHLLSRGASRRTIDYYGYFYKSRLISLLRRIDEYLARWAMRKFKRLRGHPHRARRFVATIARREPGLFAHWLANARPSAG